MFLIDLLRFIKGLLLGILFLVFGVGVILSWFIAPVAWVYWKLTGRNYVMMQSILRFLFHLWITVMRIFGFFRFRPTIGKPVAGPAVIIANHPGIFDPVLVLAFIGKMIIMAKAAIESRLLLKVVFDTTGYVNWNGLRSQIGPRGAMERTIELINLGYKLFMFPEGTRSPKGDLLKFRPGSFKIARQAGVPIQPLIIHCDPPLMSKEDRWYFPELRPSVYRFEFLDPIPAPAEGKDVEAAAEIEKLFRQKLGLADRPD